MLFGKNFFKRAIATPEKKTLFENFFSLSSLKAADSFFALITLPYLVRVLGPGRFGLIAFARAFIQYFSLLIDYGLDIPATRQISINREDKKKTDEIFSSVLFIKFCFLIISLSLLMGLVFFVPRLRKDYLVYLFTFGVVIGHAFLPVWFFQGMEKMKHILFLNIVGKFVFAASIFIFIRHTHDYIYVPLIESLGFLIAGILGLWIARKNFKIRFSRPNFKTISHQLKEGWHVFISGASISLYTTSTTFILGLFASNAIVGYYSAAERFIRSIQRLLSPMSNVVFPYISKLANESRERALRFIRKLTILLGGGTFIISLTIFIFAAPIVNIVLGGQYYQSVIVLRILAFLPFIISLSNILGIQTMLTFNHKKAFSGILVSVGVINIILSLLLTPPFKHIGISVSLLITEILVTIAMFIYLKQKKLISFNYILTGAIDKLN